MTPVQTAIAEVESLTLRPKMKPTCDNLIYLTLCVSLPIRGVGVDR